MAVIDQDVVENVGLIKEFDTESTEMLMQIVQKDLYTKPIESSIRETFSNCYDAIIEKKIALSILRGDTTVEDHFVVEEGKGSKASKFNPSYYHAKYLDEHENKVTIEYLTRTEERDLISISDKGVGLANGRLEGYFSPGFSSKRLSKDQLGKYGLGNKSPLATNIEFYILETWYNGHYTKFMIYDNYYKCIISEQDAVHTTYIVGKRMVDGVIVEATENVYWTATGEKNGVKVSWDIKKHNKEAFINAIKDQLLYFKNDLYFYSVNEEGSRTSMNNMFASKLYETKSFIISDNSRFTQPHILINNVNYGNIDFSELGINKKFGNIAIKAGSSDIDITASREMVKWTEKTRNFILNTTEEASYEAGEVLKEVLDKYENPIERFIQANSSTLNFAQSKNSEVIKQLKSFCGEIKMSIPLNITHLIDPEIRKKVGIPETIEINKMMLYVDTLTSIHQISINQYQIRASKGANLSAITMNKKCLFFISDKGVKGLNTTVAHYWSKGDLDFQYIVFRDVERAMLTKEEAAEAKIPYKNVVRNYYLQEIYRKAFKELLKEYMTSVNSLDAESIKEYAKSLKIIEDNIITVKEDGLSNYSIAHKSEKEDKDEMTKLLKKQKVVLPYKILNFNIRYSHSGIIDSPSQYDRPSWFNMETIKQGDLVDTKATVVYATTKDRLLLESIGLMLHLKGSLGGSFESDAYLCIMISEENVKFFTQIPNSMSIQSLFKETHEIVDGHLKIKSGQPIMEFMTNLRLQQAMAKFPSYFTLSHADTVIFKSMEGQLELHDREEDKALFFEIRNRIRTMPLSFNPMSEERTLNQAATMFSKQLASDAILLENLFKTLENMTILQDIPDSQYIQDEELKAMVTPFTGYTVEFYNKSFVENAIKFMRKYEQLLHYCMELDAISRSSYSNSASTDVIRRNINSQISEFFNQLNP